MKRFGLLMMTLMVCVMASAQITWNVKAGGGLANLRGDDLGDASGKFGWKIGVGLEKPLSENWLIMPSLEFKQKGTKIEYEWGDEKVTASMAYLQLPILGAYRTRLSDDINMTLKAGPYLALALSSKLKGVYKMDDVVEEANIDLFDEGIGKRFDAGLLLGVDFEYHRFVVGAEFEYGLLPCIKDNSKAFNTSIYVTLGYKF